MTIASPDDDDPPPKKPPRFCPWCGGAILKRWTPNQLRSLHQRLNVFKFPSQPLFETKQGARDEAQRVYDDLEASGFSHVRARELYQCGKCACSYAAVTGIPHVDKPSPCPIHAPLRKSRKGRS